MAEKEQSFYLFLGTLTCQKVKMERVFCRFVCSCTFFMLFFFTSGLVFTYFETNVWVRKNVIFEIKSEQKHFFGKTNLICGLEDRTKTICIFWNFRFLSYDIYVCKIWLGGFQPGRFHQSPKYTSYPFLKHYKIQGQ